MKTTDLQNAVLAQLGFNSADLDETSAEYGELKTTLSDIYNHGIDGGFHGFIYYTETVKFFDDNREIIIKALYELSEEFGQSVFDMVKGFKCLDDSDGETVEALNAVLSNISTEHESDVTQIKNCLAWFAAEQVAQELTNE